MVKITEADVYHTLSYHVGKSKLEIWHELREGKGVDFNSAKESYELSLALFRDISYGTLNSHLDHLEEQGFARCQVRSLSAEQLALRDGAPQWEYFLTPNGIKNMDKYERKEALNGEEGLEPI
ncbi:MAG TPA: hypothetical protein VJH20_01465 [Candidatus Nanoarchaeia archaeon]|nr:hypothetical protein [Candidatus Pacearchaeota archaeon]HLC73285.1 hypothetical protein [Candidatus Nanoarchaeia archaeon]